MSDNPVLPPDVVLASSTSGDALLAKVINGEKVTLAVVDPGERWRVMEMLERQAACHHIRVEVRHGDGYLSILRQDGAS